MGRWSKMFSSGERHITLRHAESEAHRLLPAYNSDTVSSALPSKEVTKVALRLKHLIEQVIPCELEETLITKPNSAVVTTRVLETAREAGGTDYRACVVFSLLVCIRWFRVQSRVELWDTDLHQLRAVACEMTAKHIIETEQDQRYLLEEVLLNRFSIFRNGEESEPINVIEFAVDLHTLRVIASSGYQKCIKNLWYGWLCQDDRAPTRFIEYDRKANTNYWTHFDPDRMRVPLYQNCLQIAFSVLYLALYTGVINTVNSSGDLDIVEGLLYLMTLGFVCDEVAKVWKVGRMYFGFWNAFNATLYILLAVSLILRVVALTHSPDTTDEERIRFNKLSYNVLAFSAPMFWMRLLLYLDTFRFFGAMLVILKVMMKESLIFFALLIVVLVGFTQAFLGMDQVDEQIDITSTIFEGMANSIMQNPDFDKFRSFAPPFGIVLYYVFTFIVMVLLLNILIALYNSAYEDITGNAVDEYLALFAQKTIQFVRAPDENVFIAPFNLIEIFLLILPFEWWLPPRMYDRLNHYVMGTIYAPLLLITSWWETREAKRIVANRRVGEEDDDEVQEWERAADEVDFSADGWDQKVDDMKPNVEVDLAVQEVRKLKKRIEELATLLERSEGGAGEGSTADVPQHAGTGTNGANGVTMSD